MAATFHEVQSFMLKFCQLSNHGYKANLNFNTQSSQIFVNFGVELGSLSEEIHSTTNTPSYQHVKPTQVRRRNRRKEVFTNPENSAPAHKTNNVNFAKKSNEDNVTVSTIKEGFENHASDNTLCSNQEADFILPEIEKNATDLHYDYDTCADTFKGENTEAETFEQHDPTSAVETATISLHTSVAHTHPFPALNDDGTPWTPPSEEDMMHYLREHGHRAHRI